MKDNEERSTHESYGMVSFSRRTGNPGRLFGSPLNQHESYVCLSIRKSELIRDGLHDRTYGSIRGDLIEVDMSAAQFAELLTTMNVGMGVPCTISSFNGRQMERPPEIEHEVEKVRTTFKKELSNLVAETKKNTKEIWDLLDTKGSLSKADREKIKAHLSHISMELEANMPYTLDMFREATEKVVVHAKAEVDAFVTANVVQTGLRTLIEQSQKSQTPALPAPEDDETAGDR